MPMTPMDIVKLFPVRKSAVQKLAFRDIVQRHAAQLGYRTTVESGKKGCQNLIIGDPAGAKYLVTAHYDTAARMPVANRLYADNPIMYVLWQFVIALAALLLPVLSAAVGAVIACIVYMQINPILNAGHMFGLAAIVFLMLFIVLYAVSYTMIYIGPANPSNANDNTSGILTLLEIMDSMPENQRHKVCFVLFDQNEKGLAGSLSYRKMHRMETDKQLVLNLSCVGDGEHILLSPAKMPKDKTMLADIYKCCGYFGNRSILVQEKGTSIFPSDHRQFPYGIGISAYHKGKTGYYIDRIHTPRDTVLDITNVNLLRAAICSMICGDAVH